MVEAPGIENERGRRTCTIPRRGGTMRHEREPGSVSGRASTCADAGGNRRNRQSLPAQNTSFGTWSSRRWLGHSCWRQRHNAGSLSPRLRRSWRPGGARRDSHSTRFKPEHSERVRRRRACALRTRTRGNNPADNRPDNGRLAHVPSGDIGIRSPPTDSAKGFASTGPSSAKDALVRSPGASSPFRSGSCASGMPSTPVYGLYL